MSFKLPGFPSHYGVSPLKSNEEKHFLFKKENKGAPYEKEISNSKSKKEVDYTKKPKVEYKRLKPFQLGHYNAEDNVITLGDHYNVSVSDILKNPKQAKQTLISRGETYRHEKKHHDQLLKEGKKGLRKRYIDDETKALESHMDPFVHAPEHRQKKDWEVHPEVKTAKKYQSINPALGQITADRYTDWWRKHGQYITPGTVEFEAEQAAYTRKGKPYKKFDKKEKYFK